ncbi:MAG: tetratricopeptide repeat protein [Deltaproteobacteria bacterium]|nr:tetratricopeptide repeat protein [Deltaproteobacteria bacterium]
MTEEREDRRARADKLVTDGRCDEAIILFEELLAEQPHDESLLMSLAWALRDCGELSKSKKYFETLLERELSRDVFSGFAYDELVRLLRDEGDHAGVIDLCERTVARYPGDPDLFRTLGEECLKAGTAGRAVEVFSILAEGDPGDAVLRLALALALVAAGRCDEAEAAYRTALSLEPSEIAPMASRWGDACEERGLLERAVEGYREALRACPTEPIYCCRLGDVLVKQDRTEEACDCYEQAVRLDPAGALQYWNRLARSLGAAGRWREAAHFFSRALERDPNNPLILKALAEALLHIDR